MYLQIDMNKMGKWLEEHGHKLDLEAKKLLSEILKPIEFNEDIGSQGITPAETTDSLNKQE